MTRKPTMPPIMSLPAEILLMIFYWASRRHHRPSMVTLMLIQARHGTRSREEDEARNSEHTAATSQQLAFVCSRWRDVLAMRAIYWKSLNITIDGDTFIPSVIKTFFLASRDNKIQVTVAPRDLTVRSLTATEEHERLAFIIRHMKPHFGRLSRLSIKTFYRSTVVNVSCFFAGALMPKLSHLHLVSQDTDDDAHLKCSTLRFPLIRSLDTDAKSFVDLMNAGFSDSVPHTSSDAFYFSVTKFRPRDLSCAPSAAEFFDVLHLVNRRSQLHLTIRDVALACEDYIPRYPPLESLHGLEVYDLEGPVFSALCSSVDSYNIDVAHVVRCEAEGRGSISCSDLHVVGIDSSSSLLRMVQDWDGIALSIDSCQGFDDWFLGSLAFCSQDELRRLACPELTYLEITGCTFSARALQRTCEMRLHVWRKLEDEADRCITSIKVKDGPKLEEGLRSWFEENLETFSWVEKLTVEQ